MELTTGTLIFVGSTATFVVLTVFLMVYLAMSGKKMKKILKENEFPED